MDFAWDDKQAAFRSSVRTFLAANLPVDWERLAHGPGSEAQTRFSKEFCAKLAHASLLVPHWPERWGGRDADPWTAFILAEEMWAVGEPRGGQYMNVNWIGPTLMRFGTKEQQERYIPPMARGETLWCQGFSEPESGSDLASLRTQAERHGSSYRINGQKIWTSYAGAADTCYLLARTAPGKNGISIFLVPMETPGITVRDIPSIIGEGDIHEVFFDDAEVPATAMLGSEGDAWNIVRAALQLERVGIPRFVLATRMLERAIAALKKADRLDPSAHTRVARARAACEVARLYSYQIVDQRRHGTPTGPEASAARVATVMCERLVAEFVVEHCAEALAGGDPMLLAHHQRAIVAGIASGAAEIQLNLVATELLKLPGAALMDFTLTADQLTLATAVDGLAAQFRDKPIEFRGFALVSEALEQQLAEAEFFDIAATSGLGPVAAAMTVERLARLPYTAEVALSMLVRPHVSGGQLPRPFAFVEHGRPGRFVASAKTLLVADGDKLGVASVSPGDVELVESIYAYPMGRLTRAVQTTPLSPRAAAEARTWLRVALAAEAAGLIQAAIDSTVEHLTVRKQFGRALGTFQALRHRMAECAVLAGGVKWLALKAAATGSEGDAALAAFHAQESGSRIAYDLHQMLGAMGMTLEHPLHLWTYRLKLLLSELGGPGSQAQAVVQNCFG